MTADLFQDAEISMQDSGILYLIFLQMYKYFLVLKRMQHGNGYTKSIQSIG